jgi:hypothetical protein
MWFKKNNKKRFKENDIVYYNTNFLEHTKNRRQKASTDIWGQIGERENVSYEDIDKVLKKNIKDLKERFFTVLGDEKNDEIYVKDPREIIYKDETKNFRFANEFELRKIKLIKIFKEKI